MINWEIVFSIITAYIIIKLFWILLSAFIKAYFPKKWEEAKKDFWK